MNVTFLNTDFEDYLRSSSSSGEVEVEEASREHLEYGRRFDGTFAAGRRDVSTASWREVVSVAAVADCLAELVVARGWEAPAHHWDFATITLCSLAASLERSKRTWGCTKVAMLGGATLRLLGAVARFAAAVPARAERQQPSAHVAALPAEWADVFAPDLAAHLLALAAHMLEPDQPALTACHAAMLEAVRRALPLLRWQSLPPALREGGAALALRRLCAAAAGVLSRVSPPACKFLAFDLLVALAEPLVQEDGEWPRPSGGRPPARAPPD